MEIPKFNFILSNAYDDHWKIYWEIRLKREGEIYPEHDVILNHLKAALNVWKEKHYEKVLTEMAALLNLEWKTKFITVYIVGRCVPMSSPLTLGIYPKEQNSFNIDYFIDDLIHELIHVLLTQNALGHKLTNFYKDKYPDEHYKTYSHIPIHAIYKHLYLKLYGEKDLQRNMDRCEEFMPNYKKSWDIVNKIGYEKIIEEIIQKSDT